MRSLLSTPSTPASLFLLAYLSQSTTAKSQLQQQSPFTNDTISWDATSSPLLSSFVKRTTCSGTCDECYGTGSVLCGSNDACFNPTIGESCCAQYNYACSDGYYCAPDGLDEQCCANSVSTSDCTASINAGDGDNSGNNGDGGGGGGSGGGNSGGSSGLSTGAKAGIGVGAALIIIIIAGLVAWLIIRARKRKRTVVSTGPAAWQMPELNGGPGGPGVTQTGGYDNGPQGGYGGPQGGYDPAYGGYPGPQAGGYPSPQGGYGGQQGGYDNSYNNTPQGTYSGNTAYTPQSGTTYNDPQALYGVNNPYPNINPSDSKSPAYMGSSGGGPPVAEVYTPAVDGAQKSGGYSGFVPSPQHHAELAETSAVHGAHPPMNTTMAASYPPPSQMDRAGAAEMYGGEYRGGGGGGGRPLSG